MTLVVILNIVGSAFVVLGICTLLGWAIASSREARPVPVAERRGRTRPAPAPTPTATPAGARGRAAARRSGHLRPFPN